MVEDGRHGLSIQDWERHGHLAEAIDKAAGIGFNLLDLRSRAESFRSARFTDRIQALLHLDSIPTGGSLSLDSSNATARRRGLPAGDLGATFAAFLTAWFLRFDIEVIPVTKNVPDFGPYLRLLPFSW